LHGERRLFYPDGTVQIIEHYEHGRFEGLYQAFYPNGQLELEGRYVANEMTGEWKRYYDSGELMEIVTFAHNAENGPFREFYKNGRLKTEGTYRGGDFEHGELKKYDENGTLVQRMQCLEGICQTVWTLEEGELPFDEEAFRAKVTRLKTIERLEAAARR
ncbi:MAG: toxin-antitoxin system YwqK family antitoxin, partial [Bacteroidetes bacterium]